jgi:glutamine synthetase
MVLFRNGVRQALRRAGYHASFVCRPPFRRHHGQRLAPAPVAGGRLPAGRATCARTVRPRRRSARCAPGAVRPPARTGWPACWRTPRAWRRVCTPRINAYGRFRPTRDGAAGALWGVTTAARCCACWVNLGDGGTRIENRIGEPMANPYLALAAQAIAGLDGCSAARPGPRHRRRPMPPARRRCRPRWAGAGGACGRRAACSRPGPTHGHDVPGRQAHEVTARYAQAPDPAAWERREYFSRNDPHPPQTINAHRPTAARHNRDAVAAGSGQSLMRRPWRRHRPASPPTAAACLSCATCHVIVPPRPGLALLPPPDEADEAACSR